MASQNLPRGMLLQLEHEQVLFFIWRRVTGSLQWNLGVALLGLLLEPLESVELMDS